MAGIFDIENASEFKALEERTPWVRINGARVPTSILKMMYDSCIAAHAASPRSDAERRATLGDIKFWVVTMPALRNALKRGEPLAKKFTTGLSTERLKFIADAYTKRGVRKTAKAAPFYQNTAWHSPLVPNTVMRPTTLHEKAHGGEGGLIERLNERAKHTGDSSKLLFVGPEGKDRSVIRVSDSDSNSSLLTPALRGLGEVNRAALWANLFNTVVRDTMGAWMPPLFEVGSGSGGDSRPVRDADPARERTLPDTVTRYGSNYTNKLMVESAADRLHYSIGQAIGQMVTGTVFVQHKTTEEVGVRVPGLTGWQVLIEKAAEHANPTWDLATDPGSFWCPKGSKAAEANAKFRTTKFVNEQTLRGSRYDSLLRDVDMSAWADPTDPNHANKRLSDFMMKAQSPARLASTWARVDAVERETQAKLGALPPFMLMLAIGERVLTKVPLVLPNPEHFIARRGLVPSRPLPFPDRKPGA